MSQTKANALRTWLSGFLDAYPSSSVPQDAVLPYLTYELVTGALDSGEVSMTVDLYFYTESEAVPNAKAQEISDAIGTGGKVLPCQDGFIWVKRGVPFCQSVVYESDSNIKRRYINLSLEYLTQN